MTIFCVGDSITYGATLPDLSQRWTDLTAARTGHKLVNCGIGGDTTTGIMIRCHTQIFPQKPDAVLILGGSNDISFTWEYRQACANVVSMVRNAQAQGIRCIVGIPVPMAAEDLAFRPWDPDRDRTHIALQCHNYAQWLILYCRERNIPFVDFYTNFLNDDGTVRRELFSDGLHPNTMGHQVMADTLCRFLPKLLEE